MEGPLGNAKWSRGAGWQRHDATRGDHLFFGCPVDHDAGVYDPKTFFSARAHGHFLTVAPTRAGKGVSLIIPNLLCYRGSAIVLDPKGELAWITAPRRRELGQKICIVDPWNQVNDLYGSKAGVVEEVAHFNPLSVLKEGSGDFVDNLAYLADSLIITESARDPHWDDSARELVAGLMAYVVENPAYAPHASLGLVRKLLSQPNDVLERAIAAAMEEFPDSIAAAKLGQFKNPEKVTGIASVISTARTQTGFLDSKNMRQNMAYSDFSFDEMREGGRRMTVYLVLPPHLLSAYARWLRLMVSIAVGTLQKGPLSDSEKAKLRIGEEPKQKGGRVKAGEPVSESAEAKEQKQEQWEADQKKIWEEFDKRLLEGGGKGAVPKMPITASPGPTPGYKGSPLKPLTKLPPELRDPTVLQKAVSYFRKREERKSAERRAEVEAFMKQYPLKPYSIGGLTIDPNLPKPSKEEIEAEWKKREAQSDAIERGEGLPVLFLLDEFGTIGRLGAISTAFGLAAGTGPGISMWAFVQDLNQLKRYYPEEFESFLGNIKALICFGNMDAFTLGYVSHQLGMRTIKYHTTGETTSKSMRIRPETMEDVIGRVFGEEPKLEEDSGSSTTRNTTEHVVAQPLASADEIRKMDPQKCIVIGHGDPVLCQRVDYYRDEVFSRWARPDPKYAKA